MHKFRTAGVISAFNHRNFISESVLSLANQVDEIVVVDDYSSDGTVDILKSLNVPNMKLIIHNMNLGVSASYNEAVDMSQADLIVIQGGDDVACPGRVVEHIKTFSNSDAIVSFSQPRIIDSVGRILPEKAAPEFFPEVEKTKTLEHLYFAGNFICAPSVALRKRDFEHFGGFNVANSYLQDYELWLKLSGVGSFEMSNSALVKYRKHEHNLSRDSISKSITYTSRFDAEMDYVLESSIMGFNDSALAALGRHIGLSDIHMKAMDRSLLLALVQLSHSNVMQVRRGFARIFEAVGSRGGLGFLADFGIDGEKLNEYARICDHRNASAKARLDFRVEKLL